MKKYILSIIFTLILGAVYAQRGGERYDPEKLKAAKVAYITTRLDLNSSQAEKFWPIYNEFSDSREIMIREMAELNNRRDQQLSEEEARVRIAKKFEIQQKLIIEEKSFVDKVSKVISYNQIFLLNGLSRDFARHIYQRERKDLP
ncbi:hypothetical protein [Algoriphagus sp.]|uniref:hypothetical protein n=1 Tax=Algoriphagus sp. TaxID=1872435 RepID=UPI0025D219C0|nr:hypothetical protein [Algoriphagus sp.]